MCEDKLVEAAAEVMVIELKIKNNKTNNHQTKNVSWLKNVRGIEIKEHSKIE